MYAQIVTISTLSWVRALSIYLIEGIAVTRIVFMYNAQRQKIALI